MVGRRPPEATGRVWYVTPSHPGPGPHPEPPDLPLASQNAGPGSPLSWNYFSTQFSSKRKHIVKLVANLDPIREQVRSETPK